jgi:carboxyl-terminal processing protease
VRKQIIDTFFPVDKQKEQDKRKMIHVSNEVLLCFRKETRESSKKALDEYFGFKDLDRNDWFSVTLIYNRSF